MADEKKLDAMLPKIRQVMVLMLDHGATSGEQPNAISAARKFLKDADADAHDLVERLTTNEDMHKIYGTGIEHGRAEAIEQKSHSAPPAAPPPPPPPAPRPGMFTEYDDVGYGINGVSWVEIAQHCAGHPEKLNPGWERDHVPSIADNVAYYGAPTWKQANILKRVFIYRFQGRI